MDSEYFEIEGGCLKVTDKFREAISKAQVINLDDYDDVRTSKFQDACESILSFIRKGMEFQIRVFKALKYSITRH